jgi:hypothetical protein
MQRLGNLTRTTLLALLLWPAIASGQATSPAPMPPGATTGPSFQSGGIKTTVVSISGKSHNVSLSLLVENKSTENLLVSVIGPPIGTNGGSAFDVEAVGGISYCIFNPKNESLHKLDRSFEISGCLKQEKPQLELNTFTLIEAGNAVPMNVAFQSGMTVDPATDFAFAMTVAIFKEADLNSADDSAGGLAAKGKAQTLPKSLRYISVGIASIPLSQK